MWLVPDDSFRVSRRGTTRRADEDRRSQDVEVFGRAERASTRCAAASPRIVAGPRDPNAEDPFYVQSCNGVIHTINRIHSRWTSLVAGTDTHPMRERPTAATATQPLTCEECGQPWLRSFEMWRTYLTEHEPPQAVTYCPDCAQREFDPWPSPARPNQQTAVAQARGDRIRVMAGSVRRRRWWRYALVAGLAVSVLGNVLQAIQ
jgi:hypothetical protein